MTDNDNIKIFHLEACRELRIEIKNPSQAVEIELLEGSAEIFGIDMIINSSRTFTSSFAVFSRKGCIIKLKGTPHRFKSAFQTPTVTDLHLYLENYRSTAKHRRSFGPTVLVAGPTDVGKSTLTRCLLNCAVQSHRQPLYIDLDVGQSSISIPGTVSILPIEHMGDLVKGYEDKMLSAYFFGYKSPSFNILLYFMLISKLSESMFNRFQSSISIGSSGAVIDTCGWVDGQGYRSIIHAAKSFQISHLVVIGDRNLYCRCQDDLPESVEVIFIPPLDGVVVRSKTFRTQRRDTLVHNYFYGSEVPIIPYTIDINYSDVNIVKIGCIPSKISKNMYNKPKEHVTVEEVPLSPELINHILGISYSSSIENVITSSVYGFVSVKNVDLVTQTITIISPQPAPLPGKILIMGDIVYDHNVIS